MAIEKSTTSINLQLARTRKHLSPEQQDQIARQLDFHDLTPVRDALILDQAIHLLVEPDVMRPMSSQALAQWIWRNAAIVENRIIFEIGTGCGIQAIVSAQAGAKKVIAGDISPSAVECAVKNVCQLNLQHVIQPRISDLFDSFPLAEKADVIIFAQPFFGDQPISEKPVSIGMLDPGRLVPKFLEQAKLYLNTNGILLMMAWPFAGSTNDPKTYCKKFGYLYEIVSEERVSGTCQEGNIEILLLRQMDQGN